MAEHRRARRTSGAAGEQQHGEVVGLDVGDGNRLGGQQLVDRDGPVARIAVDRDHVADGAERRHVDVAPRGCRAAVDDDADDVDGVELVLQLGRRARRVQRHCHRAHPDEGEVGDHERVAVAADDGDAVAVGDAESGQATAQPVDALGQLSVGDRLVAADQRGPLRVVALDDASDVDPHAATERSQDSGARQPRA